MWKGKKQKTLADHCFRAQMLHKKNYFLIARLVLFFGVFFSSYLLAVRCILPLTPSSFSFILTAFHSLEKKVFNLHLAHCVQWVTEKHRDCKQELSESDMHQSPVDPSVCVFAMMMTAKLGVKHLLWLSRNLTPVYSLRTSQSPWH